MDNINVTLNPCPCGGLASWFGNDREGYYCHVDKLIHLTLQCTCDIIDIVINHETLHSIMHKLIGKKKAEMFDNMFETTSHEDIIRDAILKVIREDGTPA